ncbi:MAG: hypothetical protein QOD32_1674 [Pyrinomonadaceae bacterium]|jgi:predicted ATP-binding protein involved in virulence|nr:hypothetical protein [Pyrinomonadaceae bacterium]
MIKRFKVLGLNEKIDFDLSFNEDLNILTGKNGSGKTTILKLLWYLISGNLERILPEIQFRTVELETDEIHLSINIKEVSKGKIARFELTIDGKKSFDEFNLELYETSKYIAQFNELNNKVISSSNSSIFFPTFRRIEGGFTTYEQRFSRVSRYNRPMSGLQEAMLDLSRTVSVGRHRFVASISTHDIVELLTQRYAETSEHTNALHLNLSTFITAQIEKYSARKKSSKANELQDAISVLDSIQKRVNHVSQRREELLRPFSVLSKLIEKVFQYQGIDVTEGITLGEAKEAISSEKLSAGEKQMLSFLCYNAFTSRSIIFIDEPELSLHVDWQRLLFPTLLGQGTNNQFIVATHSPFIYSKYPDKELVLDEDKGDTNASTSPNN